MTLETIDPTNIEECLDANGLQVSVAITYECPSLAICRLLMRNVPDDEDFLSLSQMILALFPGRKSIDMRRLSNGNVICTVHIKERPNS